MGKSQLPQKNEVLKNLKAIRLSNQGKIAMSSMNRTYKKSNKPSTIITELTAILLIINKLKFNFFENTRFNCKSIHKNLIYYELTLIYSSC